VAIAGSVIVSAAGGRPYAAALIVVGAFAVVGWVAALALPCTPAGQSVLPAGV
jgi:hypothetical protein